MVLHKREVKVTLEDVPDGSTRKGYQAHTIRDIVIYAEEVTYLREVWQFPDGSRRVAPLPPGVVKGRQQYGNNLKALTITLYHQCQSEVVLEFRTSKEPDRAIRNKGIKQISLL